MEAQFLLNQASGVWPFPSRYKVISDDYRMRPLASMFYRNIANSVCEDGNAQDARTIGGQKQ
ncbi:hypothetical protein [Sphingobacterium hotanense]|uniref:hypothetical protein n=1 Tax=Sphingobacterium hotanense TaxID=649196 RepID=UPI0011F175D5|nr:hypothetical protein [Sphingobacterium hotanense]